MRIASKTIMALTLTALCGSSMMTSCCGHNVEVEEEVPILMGASYVGTKAVIDNKQSLIDQSVNGSTGFGVFGYKTKTVDDYQRLFNNQLVEPSGDPAGTTWTYTPIKYWDSNPAVSYQFIAYWPKLGSDDNNSPYVSEIGKILTIHNIPNWQKAKIGQNQTFDFNYDEDGDHVETYPADHIVPEAMDFLTSVRVGQYASSNPNVQTEFRNRIVDFTFKHLLAKVEFRAYYVGEQSKKITVKSITLKENGTNYIMKPDGVVNATQEFHESGHEALVGNATSGATGNVMNLLGAADFTAPAVGVVLPQGTWSATNDTVRTQHLCTWLTVPSTNWNNLNLEFEYAINDATTTGTATGLTLTTTDANSTQHVGQTFSGHSYVVTLKFTVANGIEIESIQVKNWENANPSTPSVYNW